MKQLKQTTINSYSITQLLTHLDRVMTKHFINEPEPYRIDFSYSQVLKWDSCSRAYRFSFQIRESNKDLAIECINTTWSMVK